MFAPNVQEKVKSNWAHISITLLLTTGCSISSLVTTWTSAYVLIVCLIEFLKQIFHQSLQKLLCRLHAFLKLFTYLFWMIRKCKLKAFCIYLGHRLCPFFAYFSCLELQWISNSAFVPWLQSPSLPPLILFFVVVIRWVSMQLQEKAQCSSLCLALSLERLDQQPPLTTLYPQSTS